MKKKTKTEINSDAPIINLDEKNAESKYAEFEGICKHPGKYVNMRLK